MITSIILSYLAWALIPALILAALYSYFRIPVFGHLIAIVLCSAAAAYSSYELGYADRGKLDKSAQLAQENAQLQANLVEAQREAKASQDIASDAAKREIDATASAADANQKVAEYEKELADNAGVPATAPIPEVHRAGSCTNTTVTISACGLTANDVSKLRAIGGSSAGDAASAAGRAR